MRQGHKIIHFFKKHSNFIKYFFSYFLILAIMLSCFLLVLSTQLQTTYTQHLTDKRSMLVEAVSERFDTNMVNVTRIQSALVADTDLNPARYATVGWYWFNADQCITRYTVGNDFIDSICYYDEEYDFTISTGRHFKRTDSGFAIYNGTRYLSFDLDMAGEIPKNRLVYLPDSGKGLLLYLPAQNTLSNRLIFYIVSNNALRDILGTGVANEIISLAFVTPEKEIVSGLNTHPLEEPLATLELPITELTLREKDNLFVCPQNQAGLYLVAFGTNEGILQRLLEAMQTTLIIFLGIAALGILVILLAMRFTYWPLQRLIHKHLPKADEGEGYIGQLDSAFTKVSTENEALYERVEYYKDFIKKSTLDTIVSGDDAADLNREFDIDSFFVVKPDNQLYVILLKGEPVTTPGLIKSLKELLESSLPGKNPCVALHPQNNIVTMIIQYTGIEPDKEAALISLLSDFSEENGAYIAISDFSISPLDISLLYKHASRAAAFWKDGASVVSYNDISSDTVQDPTFEYPYGQLEEFSATLTNHSFAEAKLQLNAFFELIDQTVGKESPFPDFFTRCVLIDILSSIINSMNRFQVKFQTYNTLYFETLYLCRTSSYADKRGEILQNMQGLIDIYMNEYNSATIRSEAIISEMKQNFTSSDFSIFVLADHFSVSTAYVSYMCKKELGTNFSTFLWKLRQDKAIDLLQNTDMSIEAIGEAVGYLNPSSFRRKFKQETGQTPSQIRKA